MEIDKIYNEDCIETMKRMPDNFIDLTVTSPPYDNLRKYNGYCFDFENVAKQLYRVTKEGGVVVWVVGDATVDGNETCTSFKQALFFRECGFNLLDTMIYVKANYAPIYPSARRYANQFEYMFVFTKGKHKSFTAIQEKKKSRTHRMAAFRQQDGTLIRKELSDNDRKTKDATNVWVYCVGGGNSAEEDFAFEHPAIYPEQLAADHIRSWSNEGDLVYDCFMGSGTTAKMAMTLNRHYIGSEISEEYCKIIDKRLLPLRTQYKLF